MGNLDIYEKARAVPQDATKTIKGGRLKGMTDINPMYRIKMLTELFGACGIGWWYDITDKRIIADEITNQKAAFVDILLYYVDPATGKESHGIAGTGGASFVEQERNGAYMSDECFKMALTDAISVAAKALGVGADVYWQADRTKYAGDNVKMATLDDAKSYVMTFGKHSGKTLAEIWKEDRQYLEWLYGDEKTDPVVKMGIGILVDAVKNRRRADANAD